MMVLAAKGLKALSGRPGAGRPLGMAFDTSSPTTAGTEQEVPVSAVLSDAAAAAGYAPSIHNTQPWRWKIRSRSLELWEAHARRLPITDPDGRMAAISCGAALHHARVAMA